MTRRLLTAAELNSFQNKKWPCCGGQEFMKGPEGGMFVNIGCPNCTMKVSVPNQDHGLPITYGSVIVESNTHPTEHLEMEKMIDEILAPDDIVSQTYSRLDKAFLRTLGVPLPKWYMSIPIATRFLLTTVANLVLWELLLGLFYHGLHRADWAVIIVAVHGMLLTLGLIRIERTGRIWK